MSRASYVSSSAYELIVDINKYTRVRYQHTIASYIRTHIDIHVSRRRTTVGHGCNWADPYNSDVCELVTCYEPGARVACVNMMNCFMASKNTYSNRHAFSLVAYELLYIYTYERWYEIVNTYATWWGTIMWTASFGWFAIPPDVSGVV